VSLKIKLMLGCKLLAFDIVLYFRWTNMFLRNILLPSAGAEICLSDQFVNAPMSCGCVGKNVSSWNEVRYSTMGTVNIKHKKAGNSASRYGKKCLKIVRDQESNFATTRMLLSHIVTLKAPVSKST
jgi:hypothetical protein